MDCGMLTSGVLVLVATEVLLEYTPTVPVRASCDWPNAFGAGGSVCGRREACVRRCVERFARCALEVPVTRRFCSSGGETCTGGSCEPPEDCAWILPGAASKPSATQLTESSAAVFKRLTG